MACLPLIERELRVALRKQRPAKGRLKVAGLAVAGSVLFLLFAGLTGSHAQGRLLEQYLCAAGLYFVLRAPGLTAGVLAEERRNQTLGLLFLSGLSASEVFAGKFLSAALIAFTDLLALFPMLALPFLLGGVPFELFLASSVGLPVLMLFALAMSLLASSLTREEGAATVLAGVLVVLLCGLTPALHAAQAYFSPGAKPAAGWLLFSPAYGPWLVWQGLRSGVRPGETALFWQNLGLTLGWSLLGLGGAAWALSRLWREQESEPQAEGWRRRWHEWLHGTFTRRRRLKHAWLEDNPFTWLAARDRQPVALGWMVLGGLVAVWLLCWAAWPARWPSVANGFITATVLNLTLAWLTRLTAAQVLAQPRREGGYEFLLTTPLSPSQIVEGTLSALQWQFEPLAWFVLACNLALMVGSLATRHWSPAPLVVYFGVWVVLLGWSVSLGCRWARVLPVMWASLNCGRPAHAVWRSRSFNGWSWFWLFFNAQHLTRNFGRFPTGSVFEFILLGSVLLISTLVWLGQRQQRVPPPKQPPIWDPKKHTWLRQDPIPQLQARLLREFRAIVREPLPDPADPRFKKWSPQERFPWNPGEVH